MRKTHIRKYNTKYLRSMVYKLIINLLSSCCPLPTAHSLSSHRKSLKTPIHQRLRITLQNVNRQIAEETSSLPFWVNAGLASATAMCVLVWVWKGENMTDSGVRMTVLLTSHSVYVTHTLAWLGWEQNAGVNNSERWGLKLEIPELSFQNHRGKKLFYFLSMSAAGY